MMTARDLKSFVDGYIECALWSSNDRTDEGGDDPLDKNYAAEDIDTCTLDKMTADCRDFFAQNAADLAAAIDAYGKDDGANVSGAGMDMVFWLVDHLASKAGIGKLDPKGDGRTSYANRVRRESF
jgi:hypothetical protein